jgi:DNA replication protein DnaC
LNYAKLDPSNHAKIIAIAEWQNYPRGLVVVGPTGRGKTRSVWAALRPKWWSGAKIKHVTAFKMAQHATKALTDHENGEKVIGSYVSADVLFLDDLGKRLTPATSQFLFEIVERRTSANKPIIATSNEDYRTLAEKIDDGSGTMSEPIIRRLEEFCDLIVLP